MSKYRNNLPQLQGRKFLADGGMGTTLIFHEGLDLPHFCAFPLLVQDRGREILSRYFRPYLEIARKNDMGFVLDSGPTWRASADWGFKLGYSSTQLEQINQSAIDLMLELRQEFETENAPIVISGCMGPRGDGYEPGTLMQPDQARSYHRKQIETFANSAADLVTAMTLTYSEEAVGMTLAAMELEMPIVISFTVETDGCLPTGQTLRDAIEFVDNETSAAPAYYMINCAHPTHFENVLTQGSDWASRIQGIRLNASSLSHAELDEAKELDDGDPHELASLVEKIQRACPQINIVGGCCGTDHRHIEAMAKLDER